MKKICLFLLFVLPILRSPSLGAQVCDSINFEMAYNSCRGAAAPLTIGYNGTGITYAFKLDSIASATNTWQNVLPGRHTISYTGSNGCVSRNYYRELLPTQPRLYDVTQAPSTNCRDTAGLYLLSVYGGRAPYAFKMNGVQTATFSGLFDTLTVKDGIYRINMTDAAGCASDTILRTFKFKYSFVSTRYTFIPNGNCDSVGTLTLALDDPTLARPLSIALNGQPYVTDTVFRNVRLNDVNFFTLKTATGCIYQSSFAYGLLRSKPNIRIDYASCGNPAPLSIATLIGGYYDFTYRLNGATGQNNTWQNIAPGRYILTYTSRSGCIFTDSMVLNLSTSPSPMQVYAAEQDQQRSCTDSLRLFKLFVYTGQAPYRFTVNGGQTTTSDVALLRNGANRVTVEDANGCRVDTLNVYVYYNQDFATARQTFVPNTPCDSVGTYTVFVSDTRLQGPLSISIGGRPFTSDTVFQNFNIYNYNRVVIKSGEGCSQGLQKIYYPRTFRNVFWQTNYQSSCYKPAQLRIAMYNLDNVPYVLKLDGVASATNTWQNVAPGSHTLNYSLNNCLSVDTIIELKSVEYFYVYTEQQPLSACSDTIYPFKLKVVGGRPPYTFSIDYGAPTTDTIVFLTQGYHRIRTVDATGCPTDTTFAQLVLIKYNHETVAGRAVYTPNGVCKSIGTVTIAVNDPRIVAPFTISLNGRPFTSDTVFRNIAHYNGTIPYKVRDANGCLYFGYTDAYNASALKLVISDTLCANRLGRGNIQVFASSGSGSSLSFKWSNGSFSQYLTDVPTGVYSVTVTDNGNGCTATITKTLTTCVWPGDTDTSGVVNANDLLNIGLAFGERGGARAFCANDSTNNDFCTIWQSNNVASWSKQTPTTVNFKHIDADGNGVINHRDTLAITRNWRRIRNNARENDNPLEVRGAAPPMYVQTGRVVEGQWASFPIMLGDATNAATGVYGLAFSVNYDASVIDASTVYLSYNQNWLGSGDNILRISKNFSGSIEAAISRTNQQNGSGNGQIATLHFKTKTGMSGKNLAFSVDNQQVINRDAQTVPTVSMPTSTTVLTATAEPDWARQIDVYPNPTTGNVNIEGQNLEIKSVEVFDISGRSLFKSENIGRGGPLSIARAGTYFLKIQTEKGVLMRKVVKL